MKEPYNINILLDKLHFPEGPAFDKNGALWFVEQNNGSLSQYYKGVLYRHYVGGRPNGIAIDHRNLIWFCDSIRNEIRVYHPNSTATYTILSKIGESPLNLPNDLAFDDLGNLLFTCSGSELKKGDGYFCAWGPRMGIRKIDSVRYYPNGLAFNKNNNKLYIAETGTHRIWKGDWDSTSFSWNNPEVHTNTGGPIGPDGMAFDEKGRLYVAVFGSSSIHVYNDAGKLDRKILLPGSNPTNCAFDPFGGLGLIITEAEKGQLLSYRIDLKGIM
tara:strand:- start:9684 stop:10499 length:816 start_codon:yes stop_codon:yes gene_type:complete